MKSETPSPLRNEHQELYAAVMRGSRDPGILGEVARMVEALLRAHAAKEERIVLPAISVLPAIARGDMTGDMKELLAQTEELERELPGMLEDHREILAALKKLLDAARGDGKVEYAEFGERLVHHMQMEEHYIYPAALLVGRYIRHR